MKYGDIEAVFAKSFNRTILMLFKPFSFKKWIILGFIALFAGALASGGGGGLNVPTSGPTEAQINEFFGPIESQDSVNSVDPNSVDSNSVPYGTSFEASVKAQDQSNSSPLPPQDFEDLTFLWVFFGVIIVLGLLTGLLFSWLCSRFSFIFIDSVCNNSTAIKAPWRKYRKEGNSYFKLILLMFFLGIAMLGAVGLGIYFSLPMHAGLGSDTPKEFFTNFNWSLALGVLMAVVIFWVIVFILQHYVQQFVLPIMAKDSVGISRGLSKFFSLVKSNFWAFLLYLPIAIALGILCGILVMVVVIILMLLLLLLGLLLLVIPGLILGQSTIYIVYLILMGSVFVVLTIVSGLIAGAPVAVFYRAFTLAYLEKIDPHYTLYHDDDLVLESQGSQGTQGTQGTQESRESDSPPLPPQIS